jgi:hypothetical protein
MYWSRFDQTWHNIIGPKIILEIPPQKITFAIQIISTIFPSLLIRAYSGKRVTTHSFFFPPHFLYGCPIGMLGGCMSKWLGPFP